MTETRFHSHLCQTLTHTHKSSTQMIYESNLNLKTQAIKISTESTRVHVSKNSKVLHPDRRYPRVQYISISKQFSWCFSWVSLSGPTAIRWWTSFIFRVINYLCVVIYRHLLRTYGLENSYLCEVYQARSMIFRLSFFPSFLHLHLQQQSITINLSLGWGSNLCFFSDIYAVNGKLYGITSNQNACCDAEGRVKGECEEYHLSLWNKMEATCGLCAAQRENAAVWRGEIAAGAMTSSPRATLPLLDVTRI